MSQPFTLHDEQTQPQSFVTAGPSGEMATTSEDNASGANLNPTAPPFIMPRQTERASSGVTSTTATVNGTSKAPNKKIAPGKGSTPGIAGDASIPTSGEQKLSGAELKKLKAAEKAARRKEKVSERVDPTNMAQMQTQNQAQMPQLQRRPSAGKKDDAPAIQHKRSGSSSGKALPLRGTTLVAASEAEKKPKDDKRVTFFSHLYPKERRTSIAGAGKEIHPAVLALGLQLRDHVICGGNARCVATLLVFKKVIQAYVTPPGVALSRHLTTHLSHQINHLSHSRPLSVSQGNSIRWLKKLISGLDVSISDSEAISFLCASIDGFIREKITLADELIAEAASAKIATGDVILTYAKSSVVEKTLLKAQGRGKRFKVIVVDSRPLFEGKNLARSLAQAGLEVQYCPISALAHVTRQVTKCMLGASAIMGNGRLYSRSGTALVAMMAKESRGPRLGDSKRVNGRSNIVPVIVLCESIKFTSRVALDSVVTNELGDADALVELDDDQTITSAVLELVAATSSGKGSKKGNKNNAEDDESADAAKRKFGLEGWDDQVNLQLLNPMYDVTPAEYLDMVITELGSLPPGGVPVVNRISGGEEGQ